MIVSLVNYAALLPCLCIILAGLIAGVTAVSILLVKIKKQKAQSTKPEDNCDETDGLSADN